MWPALFQFYQGLINVEKTGNALRGKYGSIFRDVFVRFALFDYFFYVSIEFHDMRTECQRKLLSSIYYCIIYFYHFLITCARFYLITNHSLLNPLLPNILLRKSHSPIALSHRSLAPQSLACSHPPGP